MSVVSASHFKLARSRKSLEKAVTERDWEGIRESDKKLAQALDALFEDEERDIKTLITELEGILNMYARIVSELPEESSRRILKPIK